VVLRHEQIQTADDAGVIGKSRGIDFNGANTQLLACDEDVETVTGTMCCTGDVLYETVCVEYVKELGSRWIGSNIEVNVQVAGNDQRRGMGCRAFQQVGEIIKE